MTVCKVCALKCVKPSQVFQKSKTTAKNKTANVMNSVGDEDNGNGYIC